jgi:hypothetical protein
MVSELEGFNALQKVIDHYRSDCHKRYEIQSAINPKFGAVIYPQNIAGGGSGWYLRRISDDKALSRQEMREYACDAVEKELTEECKVLFRLEDHNE